MESIEFDKIELLKYGGAKWIKLNISNGSNLVASHNRIWRIIKEFDLAY